MCSNRLAIYATGKDRFTETVKPARETRVLPGSLRSRQEFLSRALATVCPRSPRAKFM